MTQSWQLRLGRRIAPAGVGLGWLLLISGCAGGASIPTPLPVQPTAGPTTAPTVVATSAPIAVAPTAPIAVPTTAPVPAAALATQTVTDMFGTSVTVVKDIQRIADGWPAHNSLLLMLGVADKLVATTPAVQAIPWFVRINPHLASVPPTFGTTVNIEELVQVRPDVVFLSQGTDAATVQRIRGLGLPLVQVDFQNFAQLEECFRVTGAVLGGDAPDRAAKYVRYLEDHLASVRARTSQIPPEQRPRVVHLNTLNPMKVDGRDTIIDQWIDAAGGRNAAHDDIQSNSKDVSLEQILAWDPDVLILGGTQPQIDSLRSDPRWQQLRAVSTGRAYVNPKGVFQWDRYGPEEALQIQWAAQLLHPDLFSDLDMVATTRAFYQDFFGYQLTDADVQNILQPLT